MIRENGDVEVKRDDAPSVYAIGREYIVVAKSDLSKRRASTTGRRSSTKESSASGEKFTVRLESVEKSKRFTVGRAIGRALGLGLRDALEAADGAPIDLDTGLDKEAADKLRKALETAGATVTLEAVKDDE